MKQFIIAPLVSIVMLLGLVSCSASDDDFTQQMGAQTTSVETSTFSLLDFSNTRGAKIESDGSNSQGMDEKLTCKILPEGKLMLTHKNVVFDEGIDIKVDVQLVGNQLIVNETGAYGESGEYGYYTLEATVGTMKDGDYTVVIKRNNRLREAFNITYDSSKAK